MHRLYILGCLALTRVEAYINAGTTTIKAAPSTYGATTYTSTGDCYTSQTATTLGMNNIYYQYYTFDVTKSTATSGTVTQSPSTTITYYTNALNACTHDHLYNWMAQPQVGSSSLVDGLGDALVAYGYVMSGTTLSACTLKNPVVTATLYSSTTKIFKGAKYQTVPAIITPATDLLGTSPAATTPLLVVASNYGDNSLYTAAVSVQAFATAASTTIPPSLSTLEVVTTTAQNFYYDFMQSQVITGQTQFGRGGGASTAPCGWWVVYAYESGIYAAGTAADPTSTWNVAATWNTATVHMWTDNALTNTLGAFVLAAVGAALY